MLNLSYTANVREDSEFRTRTGLDPPMFASNSFMGNIGAPMRTLSVNDDDDVDDVFESGEASATVRTPSRVAETLSAKSDVDLEI